jgi:hypothetical protein
MMLFPCPGINGRPCVSLIDPAHTKLCSSCLRELRAIKKKAA